MTPELKKKLLERMFSSEEYIREMRDAYAKALSGADESLEWFEKNQPTTDDRALRSAEAWKNRALPNMRHLLETLDRTGIAAYREGDSGYVRTVANNIMALDRDLDNVDDKWWDYVPQEIAFKYGKHLTKAKRMASNIAWTLGEAWNDDEILRERITGPIDEQELLKYLKPGERP